MVKSLDKLEVPDSPAQKEEEAIYEEAEDLFHSPQAVCLHLQWPRSSRTWDCNHSRYESSQSGLVKGEIQTFLT